MRLARILETLIMIVMAFGVVYICAAAIMTDDPACRIIGMLGICALGILSQESGNDTVDIMDWRS